MDGINGKLLDLYHLFSRSILAVISNFPIFEVEMIQYNQF